MLSGKDTEGKWRVDLKGGGVWYISTEQAGETTAPSGYEEGLGGGVETWCFLSQVLYDFFHPPICINNNL